jgi:hypothetical protein
MAKKIYPGNWVTELSSYQGQPVVAVPGRVYYQKIGYALISSTGGTSFDVTIPSPDLRQDDKPRANITGLVVPTGAKVYHVGIRVPDLRKDRGVGTATSGLVGTNTNRLKVASAVNTTATGVISATAIGTDSSAVAVASATVAPVGSTFGVITPAALSGDLTLKVYVTDNTGASAGSAVTSSAEGGTPVIVEVAYYVDDDAPDINSTYLPFITES